MPTAAENKQFLLCVNSSGRFWMFLFINFFLQPNLLALHGLNSQIFWPIWSLSLDMRQLFYVFKTHETLICACTKYSFKYRGLKKVKQIIHNHNYRCSTRGLGIKILRSLQETAYWGPLVSLYIKAFIKFIDAVRVAVYKLV